MIPIRLITGFLGSGKTTLLKNLIRQNQSRKCVYLVNEFSPADVDGVLLAELTPDSLSIPGGSIFCRCLAGQFVSHLQEIPQRFAADGQIIDELIIEASGVADPRVIFTMLKETGLNRIYQIRSVIAIIAPLNFHKLLLTLPNIRSQIEAADTILINKVDCIAAEIITETAAKIKAINPQARIWPTTFGSIAPESLEASGPMPEVTGEFAACRDPHFAQTILDGSNLTLEKLQNIVAPVAENIFRLKGFISEGERQMCVDFSQSGWQARDVSGSDRRPEIAVIVSGGQQQEVFDHFKINGMLN